MSDFLRVFLNSRSLRVATRELTLEQLNDGFDKLTAIVTERREDEEQYRLQNAERLRKIEEYMCCKDFSGDLFAVTFTLIRRNG